MSKEALQSLIDRRTSLREEERRLTERIRLERKRIADERKAQAFAKPRSNVSPETLKNLRDENKRLRGLIALLAKAEGKTFAAVGELLGVGASRAKTLVEGEKRRLRWLDWRDDVKP